MELIIKIPDEAYELLQHKHDLNIAESIIARGTVLPKGHGRLIDADCLDTGCGIRAFDCVGDCDKCSDSVVRVDDIKNAETIIEADNGA